MSHYSRFHSIPQHCSTFHHVLLCSILPRNAPFATKQFTKLVLCQFKCHSSPFHKIISHFPTFQKVLLSLLWQNWPGSLPNNPITLCCVTVHHVPLNITEWHSIVQHSATFYCIPSGNCRPQISLTAYCISSHFYPHDSSRFSYIPIFPLHSIALHCYKEGTIL